jgi:hypothetical protein
MASVTTKTDGKGGTAERRAGSTARKRTPGAPVPHLSVAERVARGKAARSEVPRASHATFEPPATRADPVELLERQAEMRVPELVPIRYDQVIESELEGVERPLRETRPMTQPTPREPAPGRQEA